MSEDRKTHQEVGGRGHGDSVMEEFASVVAHWTTRLHHLHDEHGIKRGKKLSMLNMMISITDYWHIKSATVLQFIEIFRVSLECGFEKRLSVQGELFGLKKPSIIVRSQDSICSDQ